MYSARVAGASSTSRLWGVIPREKVVHGAAPKLESDLERATLARTLNQALENNRWVDALRALGHKVEPSGLHVPVEEGETSLRASMHQGFAALLPGYALGSGAVVFSNMAFGNHALAHVLHGLSRPTPEPGASMNMLMSVFAQSGPTEKIAGWLATPSLRRIRREWERRPQLALARMCRFPATMFAAPSFDGVRQFSAALGLGPKSTASLLSIREVMPSAGLGSAADFLLLARAQQLRELANLLEIDATGLVPSSLEHLVLATTQDQLRVPLAGLIAAHHEGLAAYLRTRLRDEASAKPRWGSQTYRVLNYYIPEQLLEESNKSIAGRQSEFGWNTLRARYEDGTVHSDPTHCCDRTVDSLLERGFGLSGKLVYHAVAAINRGQVCNLVFRSLPDVFSSLADSQRSGWVWPLGDVRVRGDRSVSHDKLTLFAGMQRILESRSPARLAQAAFEAFRRISENPEAQAASLFMGAVGSGNLAVGRDKAVQRIQWDQSPRLDTDPPAG